MAEHEHPGLIALVVRGAVLATVLLMTAGLVRPPATATAAPATARACPSAPAHHPSRVGRFAGMTRPPGTAWRACSAAGSNHPAADSNHPAAGSPGPAHATAGDPANEGTTPPLVFRGGNVMGAPDVGSVVTVTPIYWAPSGYSFSSSYRTVIQQYLLDLQHDSGLGTNVFATTTQYAGRNGRISYRVVAGVPIQDATAPAADGSGYCLLARGAVYGDGTGNRRCISDDQITAELAHVVSAGNLPTGYGHVYVVMTPKGIQTCDSTSSCSVNPSASFVYCGYHSDIGTAADPTVYAHLPYSAYGQYGVTCAPELGRNYGPQAPNGDLDADAQISILSHEVAESITDPVPYPARYAGWMDSTGNENGDECSFVFGTLHGTDGGYFNQKINGHYYLTQEEWSNDDYVRDYPNGCVQQDPPEAAFVTRVSTNSGPLAGGQTVTLTGSDFTGATAVSLGGSLAASFRVVSGTRLTAVTPAHVAGAVHVYVTNEVGPSVRNTTDVFTFRPVPAVTRVSPNSGPTAGGQTVTVSGAGFTGVTSAVFGGTAATILDRSDTQLTLRSPAHSAALMNVHVVTSGGTSPSVTADRYTYRPVPAVTRVSPAGGSRSGGQSVTVTGTGFTGTTRVSFGSSSASFAVVSSTQIRATSPAHAAGAVNVYVTTSGGHNPAVTADRYTFV